jgi:hypothetical protein
VAADYKEGCVKNITVQYVLAEMARDMRFILTNLLYFVEICHKVYRNERYKEFGYCYWGEIKACT